MQEQRKTRRKKGNKGGRKEGKENRRKGKRGRVTVKRENVGKAKGRQINDSKGRKKETNRENEK